MDNELLCAMQKFERLRRIITILFYTVGFIEIVTSTTGILLHSLESSNPDMKYPSLVLEGIAIVFAAILIFVPLDGSRKSCAIAASSCAQFIEKPYQMPPIVYKQLTSSDTLCFTQPMSKCSALKAKMDKKNKNINV